MAFALAAILIVAVVVFTLAIRQKDLPEAVPPSPTAHLEERKKAIYDSLRDLQFEYRMGKLSDTDYAETKLDLQRQLAVVLAEMEKLQGKAENAVPTPAAPATAPGPAKPRPVAVCPRCSTEFFQPMKFCGECGQAMPSAS
ncbi:MAG: hypothetical protein HY236_11040 [Acidobacteria bacterium]|nr:hypothetical protein [Acidobacteriota bacterium]